MPLTHVFKTTVPSTGNDLRPDNDLRLFFIEDADGARVVLYGDRDKEIFRGNVEEARKVYAETVAHYQEREKAEKA